MHAIQYLYPTITLKIYLKYGGALFNTWLRLQFHLITLQTTLKTMLLWFLYIPGGTTRISWITEHNTAWCTEHRTLIEHFNRFFALNGKNIYDIYLDCPLIAPKHIFVWIISIMYTNKVSKFTKNSTFVLTKCHELIIKAFTNCYRSLFLF